MNTRKIEIERNVIERFLMRVKDLVRNKKRPLIYSSIIFVILAVLIISGIVYYHSRENRELIQFEKILDDYYSETGEKVRDLNRTLDELNKIIESSMWGYVNENGYYIVAGLYFNADKHNEGKEYLLKFVENSPSSFFAPLALHRAGIVSEKLNDIDGALKIYKKLETEYNDSVIADEIYYDLGRIYHLQGDVFKAKEYFNKVISDFPVSMFAVKAKKRLLLLGFNNS
ncbi:MAG: tetratricopeptide repeat protein [Spirochaetes bacterium]|nr:tetratricopeptide repeat protein [Spirochaetota bacterium]